MSWINRTLGEILTFQNGRAFKKAEWSDEGLPIIRIANLSRKDAPFNHFNGEFEDKIFIQNGDLIFSWSGSLKVEVWDRGEALLNQHLFKVGNRIKLNPTWRYYLLLNCIDVLKPTWATNIYQLVCPAQSVWGRYTPLPPTTTKLTAVDQAMLTWTHLLHSAC